MHADQAKASGESPAISSTIACYLSMLDEGNQARLRWMFDVCYAMAKESIPFAKYPALLALEARHGVYLGTANDTPDSAKAFTHLTTLIEDTLIRAGDRDRLKGYIQK